jgi:hypothetical protein
MDVDCAVICPLVRHSRLISVFVHRLARLLHTSFEPHLTMTPLCFANPRLHQAGYNLHLQAGEHARHTITKARESPGPSYFLRLMYFLGDLRSHNRQLTGQERPSGLYIHDMLHRFFWLDHPLFSRHGVCGTLCISYPCPEHGSCVCRPP